MTESLRWNMEQREIPSLYGIRGLAALAVVVTHMDMRVGIGGYAVTCFFVLSGFLITHLLLAERERTGTVSIRSFFVRRTLRIFPAFFVFCGVYLALRLALGREVDWPAWTAAVTYTSNWYMAHHGMGTTMAHVWSLATEEQFYLLWPVLFMLTPRRRLLALLVGIIASVWIYRTWRLVVAPDQWEYVYFSFVTRADALAVGCLMAVAVHADRIPDWLIQRRWLAGAAIAAIALCRLGPVEAWAMYIVAPVAFAVIILHAVAHDVSRGYWWLDTGLMRWLGKISYSVYLYHYFADDVVRVGGIFRMPLELAAAITMGALSYCFVERPVLRWRDRRKAGPAASLQSATSPRLAAF